MKAKHATMLLTVTEVEGLSEGMEELDSDLLPAHPSHPSVVMVRNELFSVPFIWADCFCIIATLLCSELPQLISIFCFWNGWSVATQTSYSFPLLYFALYGLLRLTDIGWSYLTNKHQWQLSVIRCKFSAFSYLSACVSKCQKTTELQESGENRRNIISKNVAVHVFYRAYF